MSKREVNASIASVMLKDFLDKHLARGTGNNGQKQSASLFAIRSGISESRISELRSGKGGLPLFGTLETIERIFFPDRADRTYDPVYIEWQEVRRALATHGLPTEPDPDEKRFSQREAWNLLMRSLKDRIIPIVRSAPQGVGAGVLRREHIHARMTGGAFILPMPKWFIDAVRQDAFLHARYDIHEPIDLTGANDLGAFYDAVPVSGFRGIVAYHAEAHARYVLDTLQQRPTYPPYNKKKVGLHGYQQSQRTGQEEGTYLDLDFYETDYHTHRVMRRVLHDLRTSYPALFRDNTAPYDAMPYFRYFTTSFGMNVLMTTQEPHGKRCYITRSSTRQGNTNQQGVWHISANEGVNLDDVRNGRIDMGAVVARALAEELGVEYADATDETLYLEFAIDRRNLEPFLSCLAHLSTDRETFYRRKQHMARDDRREFQEVRDLPFAEQDIIQFVLDEPTGANGFSSYCLNVLDSVLVRGLASKIFL